MSTCNNPDHECSDGKCGGCLRCLLAQATRATDSLKDQLVGLEQFKKENDILRGIASKIMPCHYCGVDSISKCPHGFPGCSLADDISCAEDSMNEEVRKLRTELAGAERKNADYKRRLRPSTCDETSRFQWGCLIDRNNYLEAQLARMRHIEGDAPTYYLVSICWIIGDRRFSSDPNRSLNVEEVPAMIAKAREEALQRMRTGNAWDATDFRIVLSTVLESEMTDKGLFADDKKEVCGLCRGTGMVDRMVGDHVDSAPCPKCNPAIK